MHSKKEPFIKDMATSAGAIKLMYGNPLISGIKPPKPKPKAKRYNIGSIMEGKKFTPMVFVNTSAFLRQTFHTLEEILGKLNFAGDLRILNSVICSKPPSS